MFREIVREFFLEFESRPEATTRAFSRQELIARVREFARSRQPAVNYWDAVVSALDAELGERVRSKRIARMSPGEYRLLGTSEEEVRAIPRQEVPLAFSRRPDIDDEVLGRLLRPDARAGDGQERSARELFADGFGGLDARAFVATGLLALRDKEYRALLALQDFAL